jgi:hypothetical protein
MCAEGNVEASQAAHKKEIDPRLAAPFGCHDRLKRRRRVEGSAGLFALSSTY